MRTRLCVCLAAVFFAWSLPACAEVGCEYLELEAWAEPNTPPEHNKLGILRYWPHEKPATAAVILIPGNGGGAPSLSIVGRWLAENAGVEVWAMDRRSNHLEDHAGTDLALRGDIAGGLKYYTASQYRPLDLRAARYMKHWGLRTHLNDIADVIKQVQGRGIEDVFLGGHSLGAIIVQAYGAYELPDGRRAYEDLRGLILFDGSTRTMRGSEFERHIAEAQAEIDGGAVFEADGGKTGALMDLSAIAAANDPNGISILAPLVPKRPGVTLPLTNLALFGVRVDTDYRTSAFCRCGRLAELDPKNPDAPRPWVGHEESGEVTDALALARALTEGRGATEWYHPLALGLDIARIARTMLDAPEMGFKHQQDMDLPVIAFMANAEAYEFADGLKQYAASIKGKTEIHDIDPPGTYAHLDPIVAADADERIFRPLKEWMMQVLAGK